MSSFRFSGDHQDHSSSLLSSHQSIDRITRLLSPPLPSHDEHYLSSMDFISLVVWFDQIRIGVLSYSLSHPRKTLFVLFDPDIHFCRFYSLASLIEGFRVYSDSSLQLLDYHLCFLYHNTAQGTSTLSFPKLSNVSFLAI